MQPFLSQVVGAARNLPQAAGSTITLIDEVDKLHLAASPDRVFQMQDRTNHCSNDSLANWAGKKQQTIMLQEPRTGLAIPQIISTAGNLAIIEAPMIRGESVISIFKVFNKDNVFTYQDIKTIETLAGISAVAIENSRVFKQSDSVTVQISEQSEIRNLLVAVSDTSPGITEDQIPPLFHKFCRIPDSDCTSKGTRLGLVVAKRFVEAKQGTIWVESEVE